MSKFRRAVLWAALVFIILLIALSIYGAFLGAERAKAFFNSLPLAVYWLALTAVFVVGLVAFRRLIRVPGLLFIHAGCILVLVGSIWASQAGHTIQSRLFGINKIPSGRMAIFEGRRENRVVLEDGETTQVLPFYVRLKDFRLEYYQPSYLHIQTPQGKTSTVPAETDREIWLGRDVGTLRIVRVFESFKIKIEDGTRMAFDDPNAPPNPALQVEIKSPGGEVTSRYVFERFPGHVHDKDELLLRYRRVIRDYVSELEVIKEGDIVAEKDIEVNHPLHFGGYHFYQHSYDAEASQYTILMVVSDTGLNLVYAGYLMLCGGVFWHFWAMPIITAKRSA
jgi:hypothetical protein